MLTGSRGVLHHNSGGVVGVGAGTKLLSVELHRSVQHDDRVGGAVAVRLRAQTRRVPNHIVLGARGGVVVEQP